MNEHTTQAQVCPKVIFPTNPVGPDGTVYEKEAEYRTPREGEAYMNCRLGVAVAGFHLGSSQYPVLTPIPKWFPAVRERVVLLVPDLRPGDDETYFLTVVNHHVHPIDIEEYWPLIFRTEGDAKKAKEYLRGCHYDVILTAIKKFRTDVLNYATK